MVSARARLVKPIELARMALRAVGDCLQRLLDQELDAPTLAA